MDPRLLDYYNQELQHIREGAAEFAREFPKIASRLALEATNALMRHERTAVILSTVAVNLAVALAQKGKQYEKLDQLTMELLFGVR